MSVVNNAFMPWQCGDGGHGMGVGGAAQDAVRRGCDANVIRTSYCY